MPTLEELQHQVKQIEERYGKELDTFGTKKEFKYLPESLYDDETIKFLTSGFLENNTWMIVCTNKRILALDKGMVFGLKQQEIPLDKISSVSFKKKIMYGEIQIVTSSSEIKIENIFKDQVELFVKAINEAQEDANNTNNQTQAVQQDDTVSQIEKLAKLKDDGILTEEEFTAKKKQLLGI
ncbi:hypothetical protein GWK91_00140 [Virgibacillus sp. MSP4-1]|uniref:PH domain-containing protein n=1 Tax=Virgibacillus sp. MSP4-1 TaxID=2700081 RepID=UPI0003AA5940|nr:PH domain-containing protein [Virgibacillus sp. MSP4-1]QHS21462.1 hypothetical protein GWK91_00140 [Virgibacillus sp. MSP4-1]